MKNSKTIGIFVILIAILFILKALGAFPTETVAIIWPFFLGMIGLLMLS